MMMTEELTKIEHRQSNRLLTMVLLLTMGACCASISVSLAQDPVQTPPLIEEETDVQGMTMLDEQGVTDISSQPADTLVATDAPSATVDAAAPEAALEAEGTVGEEAVEEDGQTDNPEAELVVQENAAGLDNLEADVALQETAGVGNPEAEVVVQENAAGLDNLEADVAVQETAGVGNPEAEVVVQEEAGAVNPEADVAVQETAGVGNPEAEMVVHEEAGAENPEADLIDQEDMDTPAADIVVQEEEDMDTPAADVVLPEEGEIVDQSGEVAEDDSAPAIPQPVKPSMKREITLVVSCEGEGVCREQETGQPLRVLPKSFSHVYKNKEAGADSISIENIPAFKTLYVFARDDLDLDSNSPTDPGGWYQVGYSVSGPAIGWMQARDVLEWKQALIVSYRHPGLEDMRRDPVLMFRTQEALREVVQSAVREDMMTMLYEKVDKGDIPPLLASKEPERYVDIDQKFYLLPILDYEVEEIDGDEVRYLQLAAAVPRKRGTDVLEDEAYRKEAETEPGISPEEGKELKIDVVFVMDMSRSMQPYIDSTRDAIKELVRSIASDDVKNNVRFGLVGYRDDIRKIAALEFTSKNLTPSLVDVDSFITLLEEEARATSIGSMDYAEEVYAGVETGLGSAWTDEAIKLLFLVGDASAHEPDHEQSTTGKNAEVLNQAARTAGVRIFAVHLLDPRMTSDHAIARRQYTTLSQFEGAEESALVEVSTDDKEGFSNIVKSSAGIVFNTIEKARQGKLELPDGDKGNDNEAPVVAGGQEESADDSMAKLMDSALIEYLGKEADPPKDIVVWALDRDISNPMLSAMDVRVLLNKDQLSDLIKGVDQVIKALARAEVSQQKFFEALQGVAGLTLKQPDAIDKADKLARSGLLPSFIRSLPYKSEILSLSDEMYAAMTAEQRSALESNLGAKLRTYQDINEDADGWISLNETNEDDIKVYPLLLDSLP